MEQWPELISVVAITSLALVSPGPDFAVITKNSLSYGRRSGVFCAIGVGLGILVHVAYCLLGIGYVISKSIVLFSALKWLGALYLVYLGIQAIRSDTADSLDMEIQPSKDRLVFDSCKEGFVTNALNPKATLFFFSLFTQVIDAFTPVSIQVFYGCLASLMGILWFSLLALFMTQPLIRKQLSKVQHYVLKTMGVCLVALGIKVALAESK